MCLSLMLVLSGVDSYDPLLRNGWCDAVRQHGLSPEL